MQRAPVTTATTTLHIAGFLVALQEAVATRVRMGDGYSLERFTELKTIVINLA